LALLTTPAAADLLPPNLFTVQTTFTGAPDVVQVGETTILHLSVLLVPDFAADAAASVIVFGTAFVFPDTLSITDGAGHVRSFALDLTANIPSEYTFTVSYSAPGVYLPTFQGSASISVERLPVGTEFIHHVGATIQGSTQITAVPAPIAGAGLPGLVFAVGGMLAWWRRKRN
jgi:hypothetical protein